MLTFYLCAQKSQADPVEIIESFDNIHTAIEALDLLNEMTDGPHYWIGQVPSRLQRLEAEPILY